MTHTYMHRETPLKEKLETVGIELAYVRAVDGEGGVVVVEVSVL